MSRKLDEWSGSFYEIFNKMFSIYWDKMLCKISEKLYRNLREMVSSKEIKKKNLINLKIIGRVLTFIKILSKVRSTCEALEVLTSRATKMLQLRCHACGCQLWHLRWYYFLIKSNGFSPQIFTLSYKFKTHASKYHKMITNISNRNTRMRCCQTLFAVNCWLADWSKEVVGEIQFKLQLP